MKHKSLRITSFIAAVLSVIILSGCDTPSYDNFKYTEKKQSELKPLVDDSNFIERDFYGIEPTVEKTIKTVSSEDGLCVIQKKNSYYDVVLDYENGNSNDIGAAYAEAILKISPEYPKVIEGYMFEMIDQEFGEGKKLDELTKRVVSMKNSLDKNYQEEVDSFAEKIGNGAHGFVKDGKLSVEEVYLLNMVPDALRSTACSVLTAEGTTTASGHRIAARMLEWYTGSEKQIKDCHCLTHFKNGSKSFSSLSMLGLLDVLTAVNSKGVMIGELDVGSDYMAPFTYEGKTCFSYDLRYAMENNASSTEAAEYLCSRAKLYTYNVNLFVADDDNAYCVEAAVSPMEGNPVIRDKNTELIDNLSWNDSDNFFCIVNSFVTKGNADRITDDDGNLIRWKKYEYLFTDYFGMNINKFKELMTCEKIKDSNVISIRSESAVHIAVLDFETHKLQAVFYGKEDPDEIEWIDLGKMY